MKKLNLVTLAAASIIAIGGLATVTSCGGDDAGGTPSAEPIIGNGGGELEIGSPTLQIPFIREMALKYNEKLNAAGKKTLTFNFTIAEEDNVDSRPDWKVGPDVYAFPSDKLNTLNEAGALGVVGGKYETAIKDNLTKEAISFATHGGQIKGYPFASDNGYYMFYNKKLLPNASDLESFEKLEAAIKKLGNNYKFAYNLSEPFYTNGALRTFGANYKIDFNTDGSVKKIVSSFNTAAGVKAVKAIDKIMKSPVFQDTIVAPSELNKVAATVAGSWEIESYKKAVGEENLGACKLPTITIDGETKTLGSLIGYKLYGVNPTKGTARLKNAHEFASYLVSDEVQLARFNKSNIDPTSKTLRENADVKNNTFVKAIRDQVSKANVIKQTSVPGGIWEAAKLLAASVKKGELINDTKINEALENFDVAIEASR